MNARLIPLILAASALISASAATSHQSLSSELLARVSKSVGPYLHAAHAEEPRSVKPVTAPVTNMGQCLELYRLLKELNLQDGAQKTSSGAYVRMRESKDALRESLQQVINKLDAEKAEEAKKFMKYDPLDALSGV